MLILTGFKNRLCHGPDYRSDHCRGKPVNEYNSNPGKGKCGIWKQEKVKTGSDCTANSGPFPNQYQHIYMYLTLQHWVFSGCTMGLLPDRSNSGLRMRRECWERFPCHRGLAIPTCITAACRDRKLTDSFEVGSEENRPGIPGACANRNFTYLVIGPWWHIIDRRWWCFKVHNNNCTHRLSL